MMNTISLKASSPRRIVGNVANRIAFDHVVNQRDAGQPRKLSGSAAETPTSSLGVHLQPAGLAKRQTAQWRGLSGEVIRVVKQEPFQIAYERAARHEGESLLEGLPRSTLRDFSQKLTLVPAGRKFHEWQDPRVPTRVTYLHIDPNWPAVDPEAASGPIDLSPRLFFDSPVLWQTALKLKALIEAGPSTCGPYAEALGVVLTHELLRLNGGTTATD